MPVVSMILRGFRSRWTDRKSTRLNSSHGYISYAVFCLKKKHSYTIEIRYGRNKDVRPHATSSHSAVLHSRPPAHLTDLHLRVLAFGLTFLFFFFNDPPPPEISPLPPPAAPR